MVVDLLGRAGWHAILRHRAKISGRFPHEAAAHLAALVAQAPTLETWDWEPSERALETLVSPWSGS